MKSVCFVVCTFVVATYMFQSTLSERNTSKHESYDKRRKRAISAIDALLQTAKVMYSWKGVTIYTKPGSFIQALTDFQRLGAKDVDRYSKYTRWGKVDDRTVSIQSIYDRPVLMMWKIQKNYDGSIELIMDKIEYTSRRTSE